MLDRFGLIERYRIVRETGDGRMQEVEVKLSDWVYNAIEYREVLTISRDYFRLRKPLERRLYEIARKQCSSQSQWRIGLEKLKQKCGSHSTGKEFKRLVSKILDENKAHHRIPDYDMGFDGNCVTFLSRGTVPQAISDADSVVSILLLQADTYHEARLVAPSWDARFIEQGMAWLVRQGRD